MPPPKSAALGRASVPSVAARTGAFYVGGYTKENPAGIHQATDASPAAVALCSSLNNPSFLARHPGGRVLYAVSEVMDAGKGEGGAITAFSISAEGALTPSGTVSTFGGAPVYLSFGSNAAALLFVNYCGEHAGVIPLDREGGLGGPAVLTRQPGQALGIGRQDAPHPHAILEGPAGDFVLVPDLGLDLVFVHRWADTTGHPELRLQEAVSMPARCGPRDVAFHPDGRWAFVTGELDSSLHTLSLRKSDITVSMSISSLDPRTSAEGNTAGAVRVHPGGRVVYVSNRGADSISVFRFTPGDGRLTFQAAVPSGGRTPRHLALSNDGTSLFVSNTDSNVVSVFSVSANGEVLRPLREVAVPAPACVLPLD